MSSTPHHDGTSQHDPLKPVDVQVFSCVVYVSRSAASGVHARVAELTASKTPIPWIERPSAKADNEQVQLISRPSSTIAVRDWPAMAARIWCTIAGTEMRLSNRR
jgi:hypothetical protein